MRGLVVRSTGSWYDVKCLSSQKIFSCRIRGKFRIKKIKLTNPLAVGDHVIFELEKNAETGLIKEIEKRENYIIRQATKKTEHGHIIASNLDQAVLIATIMSPRTSFGFIDRFLVVTEAYKIPAVICFNKCDLLSEEDLAYQEEVMQMYEAIGYKTLLISASEGYQMDKFSELLEGKKTLLTGHSGVGKSTVINKIKPTINQRVSEISTYADKGTHTTTYAEMFSLNENTQIIDTPGIKELGLIDIEGRELSAFFPEMLALSENCKFNNCLHDKEPKCSVIAAVKSGEIAIPRYDSYISMLLNDDNRR